jgi:glyoxylase-like metal-dependent hydrolase (beta-lactamase superfamily II)
LLLVETRMQTHGEHGSIGAMVRFAALLALMLAACAAPGHAKPAPYVLQSGHIDLERGPDGNTVILDAPDGLVVVDSGRHPEHSARIVAYARAAGQPIVAVVNSHWHLDHTTGNRDILAAFPKATIVASHAVEGALGGFLAKSRAQAEKALLDPKVSGAERARIERSLAIINDRAALVPGLAIGFTTTGKLGGRRIQFHLARNAATEGDLWLTLPDEQLAVVGDLVVAQFPFFDTGCEEGWTKALAAIDRARWTTLIPGHGAPMERAAFRRWRGAFDSLLDCARSSRTSPDCAAGWERDAAGFFTEAERPSVRELAIYYVDEVLRAPPKKRTVYCRSVPRVH